MLSHKQKKKKKKEIIYFLGELFSSAGTLEVDFVLFWLNVHF